MPAQIEVLPNGIWVLKDDTHISKWVKQQDRLDHDMNTLPFILPLIKPGDHVIDAGAFIGEDVCGLSRPRKKCTPLRWIAPPERSK